MTPLLRHRSTSAALAAGVAAGLVTACGTGATAPETASEQAGEQRAGPTEADDAERTTATGPGTEGAEASVEPTSTEPAPGSCAALAQDLDVEEQVGQLFMLGIGTEAGASQQVLDLLARTSTGQVVLLGDTEQGTQGVAELAEALRAAASRPEDVELLVTVDQEGGQVQRLRGPGFDRIPPATEQATWSAAELRDQAQTWGEQLRQAGVDLDLAPVADVVPQEWVWTNEPVGVLQRHYGTDPAAVGEGVVAFIEGMSAAGVGTSLKHFPGLGRVQGNTDFSPDVDDTETTRDDPGLAAFEAGIAAGASSVMVGTATYELIDPGVPAAFSPVVIEEMLRGDLGYDGVVISDDLGAAAQVQDVAPGDRALGFLQAGGDVVINGDPGIHAEMVEATLAAVAEDDNLADQLEVKTARVLDLKADLDLAPCTPGER